MPNNQQPKPDDRTDNYAKLKTIVNNTLENIEAAKESIFFSSPEEKAQIDAKNERREQAILKLTEEMKDESTQQKP